jgi:uncharacterized protein
MVDGMTMHLESGSELGLSDHQSWALLAGTSLGRLVTSFDGQPDVFPVNYVVQRETIVLRTAAGAKLAGVAHNDRVAFEADDHGVEKAWSVVVKGRAQVLSDAADVSDAERAQVLPWITTTKQYFIRIVPHEITGRRFRFGGVPR